MLGECRRLLRTGGLLVIAIPNLGSLQAYFGMRHWFHLDIPLHLCHFTENGLRRLLARSGFKVRHIRQFDLEYNPYGWLQTLLNATGIRKNWLYDRLWTFALLPLYAPRSLALALFESYALKRGGTIEGYAFKA